MVLLGHPGFGRGRYFTRWAEGANP